MKASDFEIDELVRFKDEKDQPDGGNNSLYTHIYGHICIVEALIPLDFRDCIAVRSIGTGETLTCWVTRVEKYKE